MKNRNTLLSVKLPALLGASVLSVATSEAVVTFVNPGLDGTPGYGNAPTGWTGVPFGTPWSAATSANEAAPILAGPTGPSVGVGLFGTPHSGSTFASGIHMTVVITGGTAVYNQGLQQTVSGFTVGQEYSFNFYQAVAVSNSSQDDTGSWKVLLDGVLIDTTDPSAATVSWNTPGKPLNWEERTVTFTATSETHSLAFMAFDPDGEIAGAQGVYMGIDSFSSINPVPEPSAALLGLAGVVGLLRRRRA